MWSTDVSQKRQYHVARVMFPLSILGGEPDLSYVLSSCNLYPVSNTMLHSTSMHGTQRIPLIITA